MEIFTVFCAMNVYTDILSSMKEWHAIGVMKIITVRVCEYYYCHVHSLECTCTCTCMYTYVCDIHIDDQCTAPRYIVITSSSNFTIINK